MSRRRTSRDPAAAPVFFRIFSYPPAEILPPGEGAPPSQLTSVLFVADTFSCYFWRRLQSVALYVSLCSCSNYSTIEICFRFSPSVESSVRVSRVQAGLKSWCEELGCALAVTSWQKSTPRDELPFRSPPGNVNSLGAGDRPSKSVRRLISVESRVIRLIGECFRNGLIYFIISNKGSFC